MITQTKFNHTTSMLTVIDALLKKSEQPTTKNSKPTTKKAYSFPDITLLESVTPSQKLEPSIPESKVEAVLTAIGTPGTVVNTIVGPVITRYEVRLKELTRVNKLNSNMDAICTGLKNSKVRLLTPIPDTDLIGIEVVNPVMATINLKPCLEALKDTSEESINIAIGVDTVGSPKFIDITKAPHILIAGTTGSGKSVCLSTILLSILYRQHPDLCKLVLIDPKRVEFAAYKSIPHLWKPVVTDPEAAEALFETLIDEMETRFSILEKSGSRDIKTFNKGAKKKLPYIVVIVDEMADLMMCSGKSLENSIIRLAQKARAVGIHLILATQKPSTDIITARIKSNMPTRISFKVGSMQDSRVILDHNGAERLGGKGDMLYVGPGSSGNPERFHGAWVSDDNIKTTVCNLK